MAKLAKRKKYEDRYKSSVYELDELMEALEQSALTGNPMPKKEFIKHYIRIVNSPVDPNEPSQMIGDRNMFLSTGALGASLAMLADNRPSIPWGRMGR